MSGGSRFARLATALLALVAIAARADEAGTTLAPDRVRREVLAFVAKADPFAGKRYEIEFVGTVRPLAAAPDAMVQVSAAKRTSWAGRTSFLVETVRGGKTIGRVWVATQIHVYTRVFKAAARIERLHEITESDLVSAEVDLAVVPADVVFDRATIVGRRAKQTVPAGTVVAARMVETPPLVKRGDWVTILLAGDGITLRAAGQVAQDGREGDPVRVTNLETKRALVARVVDRSTVRVEF
jgi:flagella basal body P-ring formation protein FlgA